MLAGAGWGMLVGVGGAGGCYIYLLNCLGKLGVSEVFLVSSAHPPVYENTIQPTSPAPPSTQNRQTTACTSRTRSAARPASPSLRAAAAAPTSAGWRSRSL
jgi:hypothetical protein